MEKKGKKVIKKDLVRKSYKICAVLVAFLSAMGLWYLCISPYWEKGYLGHSTLFLIGILYSFVYWYLVKMYQAQKIGLFRLTELTYVQFLSFVISDVVLCVEMIIWFHGVERINFGYFIIMMFVQMITIVTIIFIHNRLFMRYDEPHKVVIVYGNENYLSLKRKIEAKVLRYQVMACFSDMTSMDQMKEAIINCDNLYLYEINDKLKRELVLYCDSIGKDIYLSQKPEDLLVMGFDVSHTFDTPYIRTKRVPEKWYYAFVKRMIDIVCSALGLIVISPVLLITAIGIKMYDKGPVFYKQVRLTKDHKTFEIYKFRSMIVDAEKNGARLASQNDSRITPIGKVIRATRIDELPQLINILKGEMTIVGPRPERPEIEKLYLEELPEFGLRLKVKAGLTGYAQVFGKYNTTPEDKLKLDLLYINQRSLFLDLKLIFYTIKIIFVPEATEGIDENKTTAGNN